MAIPQATDETLRYRPDSNEQRERLCAAVLSLDKRFSRISLRQPKGGPDQGRDIEAVFEDRSLVFGAVSFKNSADDSVQQRREIRSKFKNDLHLALKNKPDLDVFVFFTNVAMTTGDREELEKTLVSARPRIEIFHRERLRLALDAPSGFAYRQQYLEILMSDAEQLAFFSEFGNALQSVVTERFTDVARSLQRIEFLSDKTSPLSWLQGIITLGESCSPAVLGAFRVLIEFRRRGSRTEEPRFSIAAEDTVWPDGQGWRHGWRLYVGTRDKPMYDLRTPFQTTTVDQILVGCGLGPDPTIPTLGALDQCEVDVFMNEALAQNLKDIRLIANIYEIERLEKENVYSQPVDGPPWWPNNPTWPDLAPSAKEFSWLELTRATGLPSPEYLADVPWLIDFYRRTPIRAIE